MLSAERQQEGNNWTDKQTSDRCTTRCKPKANIEREVKDVNNALQGNLEMSALPNISGKISHYVEKLQQRIYRAESKGKKRKVHELQRLLMRSEAALVVSIHKVTVLNQGKRTAGVDGYKALTPRERAKLYSKMRKRNVFDHQPKPAYRTYIRKKSNRQTQTIGNTNNNRQSVSERS